ncbi:glycosyltransferase family 2 protein [bacterium]|nr:glycosyltransferase family 2 protein [bacterium]
MSTLSVIVNTKNSARYLRAALASVAAIADEIVLVDMNSQDETLAIAAEFDQVKIYQYPQPEVGYADPAREYAFARAHGDWLLILDSDEQLPPRLARIIRQLVDGQKIPSLADLPAADIYYLPRHNEIFGHYMDKTGWYPDYQLRLWRAGTIQWRVGVHSQPKVMGQTAYLPYDDKRLAIQHHNYQHVTQWWARADRYTSAAASERATTCQAKNWRPADLWQSFFDEWWRRAFRDEGLLEGSHGIVMSLLQSSYELAVAAKVWEAQGFPAGTLDDQELVALRQRFLAEAHYWWADLMVRRTRGLARLYWRVRRKWRW